MPKLQLIPPFTEKSPDDLVSSLAESKSLITVSQLAGMLNVSNKYLYQQAKEGRLPSVRLGSLVRLEPKAVAGWLKEKRIS
jgi:excisionase family DNA binding protein